MRRHWFRPPSILTALALAGAALLAVPRTEFVSAQQPPPAATARTAVVVVTMPTGASVLRGGKRLAATQAGTVLQANDVLINGPTGNFEIRIGTQATVRLKPGATLHLNTILSPNAANPQAQDTRLGLDIGSVLVRLRSLKNQSHFVIDTPSATTAARGTSFLVAAMDAATTVIVEEGKVAVLSPVDVGRVVEVEPGQQLTIGQTLPAAAMPIMPANQIFLDEMKTLELPPDTAATEVAPPAPQPAANTPLAPAMPPDAFALFNGQDLSGWVKAGSSGGPAAEWKVENGELVAVPSNKGYLLTQRVFQDFRLHVEFWLPLLPPEVQGQARDNSGVVLQGLYELQILDSYGQPIDNTICGAVFNQIAPLRNACFKPETWQSYDITYHAPRFQNGALAAPAHLTVYQNGVLIQNNVAIERPTGSGINPNPAQPGPIALQNWGNPVRFRNIWIEPLQ